jgi:hypothetical protein
MSALERRSGGRIESRLAASEERVELRVRFGRDFRHREQGVSRRDGRSGYVGSRGCQTRMMHRLFS